MHSTKKKERCPEMRTRAQTHAHRRTEAIGERIAMQHTSRTISNKIVAAFLTFTHTQARAHFRERTITNAFQ